MKAPSKSPEQLARDAVVQFFEEHKWICSGLTANQTILESCAPDEKTVVLLIDYYRRNPDRLSELTDRAQRDKNAADLCDTLRHDYRMRGEPTPQALVDWLQDPKKVRTGRPDMDTRERDLILASAVQAAIDATGEKIGEYSGGNDTKPTACKIVFDVGKGYIKPLKDSDVVEAWKRSKNDWERPKKK